MNNLIDTAGNAPLTIEPNSDINYTSFDGVDVRFYNVYLRSTNIADPAFGVSTLTHHRPRSIPYFFLLLEDLTVQTLQLTKPQPTVTLRYTMEHVDYYGVLHTTVISNTKQRINLDLETTLKKLIQNKMNKNLGVLVIQEPMIV